MNSATAVPLRREVPEIVPIVLHQLTRLRAGNEITQQKFETQLSRLSAEELQPRGLTLVTDEPTEGHRRFVIRDARGRVQQMIECNGTCEVFSEESDETETPQMQGAN